MVRRSVRMPYLAFAPDYLMPALVPGPGERYNPKDGMGEERFDRWPPRLIRGSTYQVL